MSLASKNPYISNFKVRGPKWNSRKKNDVKNLRCTPGIFSGPYSCSRCWKTSIYQNLGPEDHLQSSENRYVKSVKIYEGNKMFANSKWLRFWVCVCVMRNGNFPHFRGSKNVGWFSKTKATLKLYWKLQRRNNQIPFFFPKRVWYIGLNYLIR